MFVRQTWQLEEHIHHYDTPSQTHTHNFNSQQKINKWKSYDLKSWDTAGFVFYSVSNSHSHILCVNSIVLIFLKYSSISAATHKSLLVTQFLKSDTQTAEAHTKYVKPDHNSQPLTQFSIS